MNYPIQWIESRVNLAELAKLIPIAVSLAFLAAATGQLPKGDDTTYSLKTKRPEIFKSPAARIMFTFKFSR